MVIASSLPAHFNIFACARAVQNTNQQSVSILSLVRSRPVVLARASTRPRATRDA
jgi:hypothetical protein|tara:strand:+ start:3060 stop:3224 length:165 start_codon:yes stop_codon:yes gene_type:complete